MNIVCIHHTNDIFYIECYLHETIEDIKHILVKKYDFIDQDLEFYQNANKLAPDIKMKDLGIKFCSLHIKGSIKSKVPCKKNEAKESPSDKNNYISEFHEMGFNDYDDIIENLMQKEGTKTEDVIVTLLKKKKK